MERNVAVWGGGGRSLMRRVVWRLEGEKYRKYAQPVAVFLKAIGWMRLLVLSQPIFFSNTDFRNYIRHRKVLPSFFFISGVRWTAEKAIVNPKSFWLLQVHRLNKSCNRGINFVIKIGIFF